MILQSLVELAASLEQLGALPLEGYIATRIGYLVTLDPEGSVRKITDLTKETRIVQVPIGPKLSSNIEASLLWGNGEYALGLGDAAKTPLRFAEFKRKHNALPAEVQDDVGVQAVLRFLENHDPAQFATTPFGSVVVDPRANVAFQLVDQKDLICHSEPVRNFVANTRAGTEMITCMVTGKSGELSRLHANFRGIPGARTTGASLISFNTGEILAVSYYGREQGANAPITTDTARAYANALRFALNAQNKLRFRFLDNVMLSWANTTTLHVPPLVALLSHSDSDADVKMDVSTTIEPADPVVQIFETPNLGVAPDDLAADYYVLGLTGVEARIAVTFFHQGKLGNLVHCMQRWIDDLALAGAPPSNRSGKRIFDILLALAPTKPGDKKDFDRLGGRLQTQLLYTAMNNDVLPVLFVVQALQRLHIGGRAMDEYVLTSLVKLFLNRNLKKGIAVSLDETVHDLGYLYGRLFAIIERAQSASSPDRKINATVRDRYWASASTTPIRVIAQLNKLFYIYVKRQNRMAGWLEPVYHRVYALVEAQTVSDAPLDLSQQALFAVGYSQQRTALWTKRATGENSDESLEEEVSNV
jgi:CRISPR-associated protein Csd1